MRWLAFFFLMLCFAVCPAEEARQSGDVQGACNNFAWNMARELDLLRATPLPLTALTQQRPQERDTPLHRRLDLTLPPGNQVQLLAKPQHEPGADSYAGLLLLKVPRTGTYRISTDQRMWIEVIGPDGVVKSTKFTMAPGCDQLHKSVAFHLQPETAYWIQLSGSTVAKPVLLITDDR